MCGLFGVVNSNAAATRKLSDFISDAFIAGSVRGMDSSGLFQIDKKKDVLYHKLPINGSLFVESRAAKAIIEDVHTKACTIGHNRKATSGKITIDNAHPFITDEDDQGHYIVGVHNGTLNNWGTKKRGAAFTVDSEWAFNYLFEVGMDAFKEFDGAYAFVWYDTRTPDVINIARNEQRGIYYTFMADANSQSVRKDTMLFASEAGMLSWLAERNDITIMDKIFMIEAGYHYQFNVNDASKFTKTKLPEKEKVVAVTRNNYDINAKNSMMAAIKQALSSAGSKTEDEVSADSAASLDERNNAVLMQELGEMYEFNPVMYDEERQELLGSISIPAKKNGVNSFESMDAIMKRVNKTFAQQMIDGKYTCIRGEVIGISYGEDIGGMLTYILGRPHVVVGSVGQATRH